MSELSGSIVARERKFRASANPAVVELQTSENTQVEREYPLIPSAKLSPGGAENRSCVWNATPRHIGGNSVLAQRERSREIGLHHEGAALPYSTCCHTFRATGITAYLQNDGTLEHAQQIAAHQSAWQLEYATPF